MKNDQHGSELSQFKFSYLCFLMESMAVAHPKYFHKTGTAHLINRAFLEISGRGLWVVSYYNSKLKL